MIWHVDKEFSFNYNPKREYLNLLYNHGRRGKHGRIMPTFIILCSINITIISKSF